MDFQEEMRQLASNQNEAKTDAEKARVEAAAEKERAANAYARQVNEKMIGTVLHVFGNAAFGLTEGGMRTVAEPIKTDRGELIGARLIIESKGSRVKPFLRYSADISNQIVVVETGSQRIGLQDDLYRSSSDVGDLADITQEKVKADIRRFVKMVQEVE